MPPKRNAVAKKTAKKQHAARRAAKKACTSAEAVSSDVEGPETDATTAVGQGKKVYVVDDDDDNTSQHSDTEDAKDSLNMARCTASAASDDEAKPESAQAELGE